MGYSRWQLTDFRSQASVSQAQLAAQRWQLALYWLLPVSVSLVYLLIIAYLGRAHTFGTYGTETDFYHYYAPDAERIAAWQFPENPFQGPGYPVLLAVAGKLTGDLFVAGKWISIISAALVVLLAFLLFAPLFGYRVGVGAALLISVGGEFAQFSLTASTDLFFLLLCLACLVVFTSERLAVPWRVVIASVLAGLAYLTRYNGLFLLAACLFGILGLGISDRSLWGRLRLATISIAVFLLVASPWLYANYKHRGSPFYSANYLNMATEFYPELAEGRVNQDGTRGLSEQFHSFGEVLAYDPWRIIKHYPVNLYESLTRSLKANLISPWVGYFALVGFVLALIERRSKAVLLLLSASVIYFLLMGLNHWETRYYFFIMVSYAGLAVYAAFRLLELARARGWLTHRAYTLIPLTLVAVMWFTSFKQARADVLDFLDSHPTEVLAACDYLKSVRANGVRILARKPHLPAICRQQWVFFPDVKSIDELRVWLKGNPVNYVVFGVRELRARPALKSLKDPETAPLWLKVVWVSQDPPMVLYQPKMDALAGQ
jgi:hypothetical protein